MATTRLPYLPAFRAAAVEPARMGGKGGPGLARDLGVAEQALRGRPKRSDGDTGQGAFPD